MASPFSSSSRPTYGGLTAASPVASRSQWWTQDAQQGGGGQGPQSSLSSTLDDRMDEPEQAANYLPGFLSASSRGRNSTSEPNPPSSQQQWLNNSGPRGMPSPPTARFGQGSLFDRSNTSPYNSPQALHSLPDSMNHEDAPPVDSLEDGDMYDGQESFQQQDYSSAPTSRIDPPPPSTASPLDSTVIVFGPPMSMLQPLLQHFEQFGEIIDFAADQGGGNWVSITYRHEQDAARAIKKNGDVLGGSYMIGVKWADPSRSLFSNSTSLFPSPSTSPKPLNPVSTSTPSGGKGTPVRLAPSSSAFRRLDQQGSLVVPKPVSAAPLRPSGEQQGKGGVFGKLGELVFGF